MANLPFWSAIYTAYFLLILQLTSVRSFDVEELRKRTQIAKHEQKLTKVKSLGFYVDNVLLENPDMFYNYTVVCGKDADPNARVGAPWDIDKSIPMRYKQMIKDTFLWNNKRPKRCPSWSTNLDTSPPSGSMDSLSISEDTNVGKVVYQLTAMDSNSEALYYFIRNVENDNSDIIFNISTVSDGFHGFVGKVVLNQKLDAETRNTYNFLVYAFDGMNMIERYSTIHVQNVDDEIPKIITTDNRYYDETHKCFEFEVDENASIGHVLNEQQNRIQFTDIDTPPNLLEVKLVDAASGLSTIPFTMTSSGDLVLTSSLDFEERNAYRLIVIVKDKSGASSEERIYINVRDVADQVPLFQSPAKDQEITFLENTVGEITEIRAISNNSNPLGPITYRISKVHPIDINNKFALSQANGSWYLTCTKAIVLKTSGQDETVEFEIEATESASEAIELISVLKLRVRVISGDVCAPLFSQENYTFGVKENDKQVLADIFIKDCDHGENGKIFLSTSDPNFEFKVDYIYREGNVALEMKKSYDYEQFTAVEFTIFARSSDTSLNNRNSSAVVRVEIEGKNEFVPEFVMPKKQASDSQDFFGKSEKFYKFLTEENKDFTLSVKAEDFDRGLDGNITYSIERIGSDDTFEVEESLNASSGTYDLRIDGMYLDASSKAPITFIVNAKNELSPVKLSNEIIVDVKASYSYVRPAYFDKSKYNFDIQEKDLDKVYKLKLINDNLKSSEVEIVKMQDKLDLFKFELQSSKFQSDEASNFEDERVVENENNEELLYLTLKKPQELDIDELYRLNNHSDSYILLLRVQIKDQPSLATTARITFKLIDENDNAPVLLKQVGDRLIELKQGERLHSLVPRSMSPNMPIEFQEMAVFSDKDFSKDFGVESVYFKLNDTRFQVDNKLISSQLMKLSESKQSRADTIPFIVRKLTRVDDEDRIWIEVRGQDSYFSSHNSAVLSNNITFVIEILFIDDEKEIKDELRMITVSSKEESDAKEINLWVNQIKSNVSTVDIKNSTHSALVKFVTDVIRSNMNDSLNIPVSVLKIFNFYRFSVDEAFIGEVGQIVGIDTETHMAIRYELMNHQDLFSIDNTTGVISTIRGLDFENPSERLIVCSVKAIFDRHDTEVVEQNIKVEILVKQVNDNAPEFSSSDYLFTLILDSVIEAGTEIGMVYIKDLDEMDQVTVNFTKVQDLFQLEHVGFEVLDEANFTMVKLLTKKRFERGDAFPEFFAIELQAHDMIGNDNKAQVRIAVVKIDEKLPAIQWVRSKSAMPSVVSVNSSNMSEILDYDVRVSNFLKPGEAVFRIEAKPEFDIESPIKYRLITESELFTLDEVTGEISTASNFTEAVKSRSARSVLFVQAFYDSKTSRNNSTIPVWSKVAIVNIDMVQERTNKPSIERINNFPVFTQPPNDFTRVNLRSLKKGNPVYTFVCEPSENITFQFGAVEIFKNGDIVVDKYLNSKISLPFFVNARTGELNFNWENLKQADLLTIFQYTSKDILTKLTIVAENEFSSEITPKELFVLFSQRYLFEVHRELYGDVDFEFTANFPLSTQLKIETFNQLTENKYVNEIMVQQASNNYVIEQIYLSIKQNTKPNSVIAHLKAHLDEKPIQRVPYTFTIESIDSTNLDPSIFFFYNNTKKQIILIRPLASTFLNSTLRFRLMDTRAITNRESLHKRYDFSVFITDNGFTSKPEITLKAQESLDVVCMLDMDSGVSALAQFNAKQVTLNAFEVDNGVNYTVGFNPLKTDSLISDFFELAKNKTHILFNRKMNQTLSLEVVERAQETMGRKSFQFTIQLSNEVHSAEYTANFYAYEYKQLKRIVSSTSTRFHGDLQRSKVPNTVINLTPLILVSNPLPFDLNIRLGDLHMPSVTEFFDMRPKQVEPSKSGAITPCVVYLAKSLEASNTTKLWSDIKFKLEFYTQNWYMNEVLKLLKEEPFIVDLTIKLDNQFAPEITQVKLMGEMMTLGDNYTFSLKEGVYNDSVGSIVALDKDEGDMGRIEYALIGTSQLSIDKTTGVISVNGILDAENEKTIVFFCYARDMASSAVSKQSETVRFTLNVLDVNEFTPSIQTSMHFKAIQENQEKMPVVLGTVSCFDSDVGADLKLVMESIRYVIDGERISKLDIDSDNLYLKNKFDIVFPEVNTSAKAAVFSREKSTKAEVRLVEPIDYERLFRPNETLIEIEFMCTDGELEEKSEIKLKIEDMNDNRPIFVNTLPAIIEVNETTDLLQPLVKLTASDLDMSKEFGNDSLIYSISDCTPDVYGFYVNFGVVYSRFDLDADTDKMVEARRKNFKGLSLENSIDIDCKVIVSDSLGGPNSLSSEKNLTIRFININDNAPIIKLNNLKENTIEVKEGQKSQGKILAQIEIFDRDDASNLVCRFHNGLKTFEYFEFRTEVDITDPFKAWCILKVQDDMWINYDSTKRSNYDFDLVVHDKFQKPVGANAKGESRTALRVHVLSVNMRAPMFLNGDEEAFYALDSARNGSLVGTILATDTENSNPEKLIYILNSTNSSVLGISDKFELIMNKKSDFHWGAVELVTKAKLDAKESPYTLIVTAYDGPVNFGTTKSSRKEIKVHVINKGSVSVWVDKETGEAVDYYTKTIDEELPVNTSVITVHAVLSSFNQEDLDGTLIIYEIEPHVARSNSSITISNPYYRINQTSGEIFTTGARLDYEEIDPFKKQLMRDLKIKATSTDGLHKYSTRVSLEIVDMNDNSPKFNQMNLDTGFCVVENTTSQVAVATIKADDMDSGLNGEIEYKLNETAWNYKEVNEAFEIDRITGQIFLKTKLDREKNNSIVMSLIASDKGFPESRSVGVDIQICVLDINDNMPIFDSELPRILSIHENSMLVNFTLKATDLDLGSNGTIFYYIQEDKSNKFIIDPITQELNLTAPLDYESLQTFNLTIISSDYGSPKPNLNKLNLKINVLDQNDNGPRFSSDIVKFLDVTVQSFEEKEFFVGLFGAVDKDLSDAFNQVGYRINTVLSRQLKHNSLPVIEDNRFMSTYSEQLFSFENGTLTASSEILNQTSHNYFMVELESYDLEDEMLSDRVNVSIVFRLPIRTSERPVLNEMTLLEPKELTISKQVLPAEKNSVGAEDHSTYVVYIIQAEDPTGCGLDYFLDSVEESQLRNSRRSPTNTSDMDQMSPNFDDLFKVDIVDGIVTAIQPRSSYTARFYRLKLRVALKCNPSIEAKGYLIVNINSKKESLFRNQVFTTHVEENLTNKTVVFDIRAQLSVPNNQLIFEFNKDNSMPTNVYNEWFSLDEITGIVYSRSGDEEGMIDYEAHREVLLGINVVDTRTFDLVETVVLKIHVQDLNDNAPVFDMKYDYNPVVNEDNKRSISEDRLMTKVRAFDLDGTSENSALSYSIVALIPAVFKRTDFKIERISDTDVFGLYKRADVDLDRDSMHVKGPIRIILEVTDNGKPEALIAQKEVLITINDVNDNPPRILNKRDFENEIVLFEDQTLGVPVTKIRADDLDEGRNGQLKYEIIGERTQMQGSLTKEKTSHFSVNQNGEVFLIEKLDYEQERNIELILRISDISTQPLGVKQAILFSIHNINDNAPVFISFPTVDSTDRCRLEIEEGRTSEVFYKFIASDADDVSGPFKFEILEISTLDKNSPGFERMSVEDNVFKLGLTSGELTLAAHHQLDRESVDNYKILIRLRDQEILGKQLDTLKECHIQIKDINDNAPQFMPEQLRANNTVLRVFPLVNEVNVINWFGATDLDLGNNATIEYELVYNDELTKTVSHIFTIDERGYLLINGNSLQGSSVFNLDDIYSFSVIARDMGAPKSLQSQLDLLIEIDENYFRVSKSVDRLELDTVNGKTLVPLEENSAVGTELVQVVVQNSFLKNQTELSRNQVQLKFKLLTVNGTFSIDELTGLIAVKDNTLIDFETVKQFLITVEATETYILNQVEKRRRGTMIIIVKVNNINDNTPVFNKDAYVMSLSENVFQTPFALEESSDLIQITDNDLKLPSGEDLPKFQNEALNVQLKGSDSHKFTLERISNISSVYSSFYRLVALSAFDAELKQVYELDINVFDGQTTVTAPLTIKIKDINDNSPRFIETVTTLDIDENLSVGTPVITVKATDADKTTEMNQTNYRITSITSNKLGFNLNSIFTIDRETGQIQVASNQLIDRELFEYFNITVRAFNPNDERMHDEVALIFRLNDLNDNKPVFDETAYHMTIREKSLFPRAIMQLDAVDLDLGSNAHVTYYIKKMNGQVHEHRDTFYMEGDKLMLNKFIDIDAERSDKHFELIIRAEDKGGLSDETTVFIDMLDVNDHAPKVVMNQMDQFEMLENNGGNESLFFFKCEDPDYSRAQLKYELVPDLNGDWEFFTVDAASGEVKANAVFDFEEKREYNLRFKCTDLNGIMIPDPVEVIDRMRVLDESQSFPLELSSTHDMRIKIIDLDDNEPEFGRFVLTRNVSDSMRVGETIDLDPTVAFIPTANDRDFLAKNRNITYFIVDGNEENKFSLNRFTGELKLVQELERTLRDVYHLEIRATSQKELNPDLVSPTSVLKVVINVVAGDLFIEFAESNYYISTPKSLDVKADFQHLRQYQFSEIRNIADPSNHLPTSRKDYQERLEAGSIFFSRAHLIQRKAKRSVRFSIELVQLARKGSKNLQRLPMDTVNASTTVDSELAHDLMLNALDLKLDSERVNLFDIDSYTGKIYINREYLADMEYNYGDTFIVTIVATAYEHNSRTVLSQHENTVTRLFVRITERDYSLVIPVTNNLKTILNENLNPLKEKYIPRIMETDGLRLTIQDLVLSTSNVVEATENSLYNVIIQVETNRNHKPCNLDGFADIWSNFSISPVYFDTINRVTERQMNKRGQEDLAFLVEPKKEPFIYNPIFWVVVIAVLVVLILIMFCVNCYCLNKSIKKNNKKSGLLIEYPPGYTPIYKDGVLNLNAEERTNKETDLNYEDQELIMNIEDQTLDRSKLSEY